VIPTHNRWHGLRRAVRSARRQRYPGGQLEIVVVDDGSTEPQYASAAARAALGFADAPEEATDDDDDGAGGAAAAAAAAAAARSCGTAVEGCPRVRMRWRRFRASSARRLGFACAGAARNDGVRSSRGALLMLLDDDDEFLEGKVLAQVRAMMAVGEGAVVRSGAHTVPGSSDGGLGRDGGGEGAHAGSSSSSSGGSSGGSDSGGSSGGSDSKGVAVQDRFAYDFSATEAQIGWGPRGAPPPQQQHQHQHRQRQHQLQQLQHQQLLQRPGADTRMHRGFLWGTMRAKFHAAGIALGRQRGEENFPRRMAGTRLLRVHNYVVTSSVAFTRALWARRGPFRHLRMHTRVPEDLDLWLRFFDEGGGEAAAAAGGGVLPASAQSSSSSSSSTPDGRASSYDPAARGVYLPEPLVYYDAGDYDGASAAAAGEGAGGAARQGAVEEADDETFE
jgi:hypothetical protein